MASLSLSSPSSAPVLEPPGEVPPPKSPHHAVISVRGWGEDRPGIAHSMTQIAVQHGAEVLDVTQFILKGSLLFAFTVDVGAGRGGPSGVSSLNLLHQLQRCASDLRLKLDFHFPDADEQDADFVDAAPAVLSSQSVNDVGVLVRRTSSSTAADPGESRDHVGFVFPGPPQRHDLVLSIVSPHPHGFPPRLLYSLDEILAKSGVVVREMEHRSDNKRESTGMYTKMALVLSCPRSVALSSLVVGGRAPSTILRGQEVPRAASLEQQRQTSSQGPPTNLPETSHSLPPDTTSHSLTEAYIRETREERTMTTSSLLSVAREFGVSVTLRRDEMPSRPNGRSLVVFSLSQVLCPYDVVDEVVKEHMRRKNGHVASKPSTNDSSNTNAMENAGVSKLKDIPVDSMRKFLERIEFTPGAQLVCSTLKKLGAKLAILTACPMKEVADSVGKLLDFDYVLCKEAEVVEGDGGELVFAGRYVESDLGGVQMRKTDLLQLMAEREGIPFRNVLTVGDMLTGLTPSSVGRVLELFGSFVPFHCPARDSDLTRVLFDLGFNGSDVAQLKKEADEQRALLPSVSSVERNLFLVREANSIKLGASTTGTGATLSQEGGEETAAQSVVTDYDSNGGQVLGQEELLSPTATSPSLSVDRHDQQVQQTWSVHVLQISSAVRRPGQLKQIFSTLLFDSESTVRVLCARMCSLQYGGMCLAVELLLQDSYKDTVLKELYFGCQRSGFEVKERTTARGAPAGAAGPAGAAVVGVPLSHTLSTTEDTWSAADSENRLIVTLVQRPRIPSSALCAVFEVLRRHNVNILKLEKLAVAGSSTCSDVEHEVAPQGNTAGSSALQLQVFTKELHQGSSSLADTTLFADLEKLSRSHGLDITLQRDDFSRDSTLIQQEVIDELAKYADVETQVSQITEDAMNGKIDFFESLKKRVALLKGCHANTLFAKVKKNLIYTPGAKELCATLRKLGFRMAVVSGGFLPFAREVKKHLGLDYAFANALEVDEETGELTGNLAQGCPVVTPERKRALLKTICQVEGCAIDQTIAVGDGANDIPMLSAAGLGIAFCAKPKVQDMAEVRINQKDLTSVLYLIGVVSAGAGAGGAAGSGGWNGDEDVVGEAGENGGNGDRGN